jgi:UDP-2,3-diacylglucosamine pyrophosphatase LpxH
MIYKYVILSDIHLGIKDSKAKQLLNLLDNIYTDHIILNGDIIDGWAIKRGSKLKKSHTKLINKFIKLSNKTKITWVRGNHDDFIEEFIGTKLGNIEIVEDLIIDINDKKYFVFHGDLIDVFITKYKWLAQIGSIGYDFALFINRIYNYYRKLRGLNYYSISDKLKKSVKFATNYINDFETTAINIAKTNNCNGGVICGHIHNPEIRTIDNMLYINSGDWIENLTAILVNDKGIIELYKYDDI